MWHLLPHSEPHMLQHWQAHCHCVSECLLSPLLQLLSKPSGTSQQLCAVKRRERKTRRSILSYTFDVTSDIHALTSTEKVCCVIFNASFPLQQSKMLSLLCKNLKLSQVITFLGWGRKFKILAIQCNYSHTSLLSWPHLNKDIWYPQFSISYCVICYIMHF